MIQMQPVNQLAVTYGVKSVIYGPPGVGKTPLIETAPQACLFAVEPGLLSMRKSNLKGAKAFTPDSLKDMMAWITGSAEARQYNTIAIDSASQMAEIVVNEELGRKTKAGNKADGKAAYGEMARIIGGYLNTLYYLEYKHIVLICKQGIREENGINKKFAYFPGNDLNVKVPHLFDLTLHYDKFNVPGQGIVKALHTADTYDAFARDRSGVLAEYEPPNLDYLFNKIMQG